MSIYNIGHEVLCQIEEAYIRDEFNLEGLNIYVKHYKQAIYFILDLEILGMCVFDLNLFRTK